MSENQADTKGKGVLERGGLWVGQSFPPVQSVLGSLLFLHEGKGKMEESFFWGVYLGEHGSVGWLAHVFKEKKPLLILVWVRYRGWTR